MTSQGHFTNIPFHLASIFLFMSASAHGGPTTTPSSAKNAWSLSASLGLKESYDSNVSLQDTAPDAASIAQASAAGLHIEKSGQASLITTVLPRLAVDYKPGTEFYASVNYAPEINHYHSAPSENFVAHKGTLNLGGKCGDVSWESLNTASYIDGNELGPTFARPSDVPAMGGIPLRDRRKAWTLRNQFKLTCPVGNSFVRPVASTYFHDFKTDQISNTAPAAWVYENYIDRQDVSAGVDLGYKVADETYIVVGYRYGEQQQGSLLGADSPYDNTYQRILLGIEGSPVTWAKLAVTGGPDFRDFPGATLPGFDKNELLCYIDASVTFMPNKQDSIILTYRRFEQPTFSSFSMYQDLTYSLTWKHPLNENFSVSAAMLIHNGIWQAPVQRDDLIYTPSVSLVYAHDHLSAELACSYDWVKNDSAVVPGTATTYANAREFSRNLVSVGLKYSF